MSEPTLNLSRSDLQIQVSIEAGYGLGAVNGDPAWTTRQQTIIDMCVTSGLRMVYFTQQAEEIPGGYDWSFLKPVSTITLAANSRTINLPDDFNGFCANAIPVTTDGSSQWEIPIRGEQEVERLIAMNPSSVSRPNVCCRQSLKGTVGNASSRSLLKFYPTADQAYTLHVWYSIIPDALTAALPWVYGGAAHAETFKSAVRAAFERDFDAGGDGNRMVEFMARLKASIQTDKRMKPATLGVMTDDSDNQFTYRSTSPISYMGITPGVA